MLQSYSMRVMHCFIILTAFVAQSSNVVEQVGLFVVVVDDDDVVVVVVRNACLREC